MKREKAGGSHLKTRGASYITTMNARNIAMLTIFAFATFILANQDTATVPARHTDALRTFEICKDDNYNDCLLPDQDDTLDFGTCATGGEELGNWIACPEGPVTTLLFNNGKGDTIPVAVIEHNKVIWTNDQVTLQHGNGFTTTKWAYVDDAIDDRVSITTEDRSGRIVSVDF